MSKLLPYETIVKAHEGDPEVPFLPYMDRPADTKAGCKHRCTDAALRYFKSEVMEMCHREGLYQIDLLNQFDYPPDEP